MIIGVDFDDVVVQWYYGTHAECEKAGITNGITPRTWRPYEEYGCADQVWFDALDRALHDGYMLTLPTYPGALAALQRLWDAGHEIHIVTARGFFANGDLIREHTRQHLAELDAHFHHLHFRKDKGQAALELGLEAFVDDNTRNYDEIDSVGVPVYLLNRPWNEPHDDHRRRLGSLTEFADLILEAQHA